MRPGPAYDSLWTFSRSRVSFAISPGGTYLAGQAEDGTVMFPCWSDPAAAGRELPDGFRLTPARVFQVVGQLPLGSGIWVDPGTESLVTIAPETVDDLRVHATAVPWLAPLVWEDFPPDEASRALTAAVTRAAKQDKAIQVLWLVGFQVYDAPREGVLVYLADEGADPVSTLTDALRGHFGEREPEVTIHLMPFAALPAEAAEMVQTRQPVFSRVGVPRPARPARSSANHFTAVIVTEEARGNSVAYDQAVVDGRPAIVMKYPLEADAIALEHDLDPGHELVQQGERWMLTCAHGGPSLIGGTQQPGRLARHQVKIWWKRWNKAPRPKIPLWLE